MELGDKGFVKGVESGRSVFECVKRRAKSLLLLSAQSPTTGFSGHCLLSSICLDPSTTHLDSSLSPGSRVPWTVFTPVISWEDFGVC